MNYDGHKFFGRKVRVSLAEKKAEIEQELRGRGPTGDDFKQNKGKNLRPSEENKRE